MNLTTYLNPFVIPAHTVNKILGLATDIQLQLALAFLGVTVDLENTKNVEAAFASACM